MCCTHDLQVKALGAAPASTPEERVVENQEGASPFATRLRKADNAILYTPSLTELTLALRVRW